MKIVVIDNLYAPNKRGSIANGAQKYTRSQVDALSHSHEVVYLTALGSDIQYDNQIVLKEFFDLSLPDKTTKRAQTKRISQEIAEIVRKENPDIVLDSSCKHMSSIWLTYPAGSVIFEHYHRSSSPLSPDSRLSFEKKEVYWCGVSNVQAKNFNHYFHDTVNIHIIENAPTTIKEPEDYGVFVGRWDGGKSPHVTLKNYLKSGVNKPLHCFIKFGGKEINPKELENLRKSEYLTFHIDAPREEIFESMSRAKFGLGMGNESTGIVCLEYAMFGVPYIVPGNKVVAESEHLPPEGLFLCDRSLDTPVYEQMKAHIETVCDWSMDQRKEYAKTVKNKYTVSNFYENQMRIIRQSMEMFPRGLLG